jgi:hypothetical protein
VWRLASTVWWESLERDAKTPPSSLRGRFGATMLGSRRRRTKSSIPRASSASGAGPINLGPLFGISETRGFTGPETAL